jgi:hypothetical protein
LVVLGLFLGAAGEVRSAYIYWGDLNGGDIRRANLDRTGQKILVTEEVSVLTIYTVAATLELAQAFGVAQ